MKLKVASVLVAVLAILGSFFAGRWSVSIPQPTLHIATNLNKPAPPTIAHNHPPPPRLPEAVDWQKIRSVRDLTLEKNPDLAAEYKSLLARIDEQQTSLDSAMVEADPKVAPIVAKLKALRHRNSVAP